MGFSFIYSYFLMNIMNTYVLVGDKVAILPCGRNKEIEPEVIFPGKKKHVL